MHAKASLFSWLVFLAIAFGARQAGAQSFQYCDFSSVAGLTLNGNASQNVSVLQLTPNATNQAGSAYRTTAVVWTATTSFETSFRFELTPNAGTGADGISFILQNSGVNAIGSTGGAIGYGLNTGGAGPGGGIAKSVEVEFDTFQNTWDTSPNHVAVMQNGNDMNHLKTFVPTFTMAGGGILYAWIDYAAATTTLSVYIAQTFAKPATPSLSYVINLATALGAQAFVGFTAGTGGDTNTQEILEWQFSTSGEPCACGGDSACGGTTPICDTTSMTCRACTTNADCTAPTPVCAPTGNPKAGLCVACAASSDCDANPNTATPICSLTGATTDTCVACTTNAGCAAAGLAPLCDTTAPYAGQCVQCLGNGDCTSVTDDPTCVSTGKTNVCGCLSSTSCPLVAPVCNTTTDHCGPCTTNTQCSVPTPACQLTGSLTGECTQCSSTNTSQCKGATPACDDATGTCVGCTSNADCSGTSPICNLTTSTCGPCATSSDCAAMTSTPLCATTGPEMGACVACLSDTDCTAPTAVCNPATDACVACLTNADCSGSTPVCNLTANTCGPCTSDADCTAPTPACQLTGSLAGECTQCSATNGTECVVGTATPVCVASDGVCGCTMTSNCAADQTCLTSSPPAGQCVSKSDAGPEGGTDSGIPDSSGMDAPADSTMPSDGATPPDGHFADGSSDGSALDDTGSIGGGGCACSAVGGGGSGAWAAAGLASCALLLGARGRRKRRERPGLE